MKALKQDVLKDAEAHLMNWGRFMRDDWLNHHILYTPLPTSEGYIAPVKAYDEPDQAKIPIDEFDGRVSEHVVVSIGCENGHFDYFRTLVHWYTCLVFVDTTHEHRVMRLAKHLKCSYPVAQKIINTSRKIFWDRKQTVDNLLKIYRMGVGS